MKILGDEFLQISTCNAVLDHFGSNHQSAQLHAEQKRKLGEKQNQMANVCSVLQLSHRAETLQHSKDIWYPKSNTTDRKNHISEILFDPSLSHWRRSGCGA